MSWLDYSRAIEKLRVRRRKAFVVAKEAMEKVQQLDEELFELLSIQLKSELRAPRGALLESVRGIIQRSKQPFTRVAIARQLHYDKTPGSTPGVFRVIRQLLKERTICIVQPGRGHRATEYMLCKPRSAE